MSRHPFDRSEMGDMDDHGTARDSTIEELERYASLTAERPPSDLADRVMSAVERAPAPRRGILAWLSMPSGSGRPLQRLARVTVVAATLVLAVAGALFAGELAQLFRDGTGSSPSPSITESLEPSPSESVAPSPSQSPEQSEDASESPEASDAPSATPRPTTQGTPQPTATESDDESKSPTPSQTPDETDTPEPTST